MNANKIKNWATPITIGAFFIWGITGILMLLKIRFGLLETAHEWIGLLMVFGVVFHVLGNLKAFNNYFKRPAAAIAIFFIIMVGISAFFVKNKSGKGNLFANYITTMQNAPLTLVAEIVKADPELLKAKLETEGFKVTNIEQTINEIADLNDGNFQSILSVVLTPSTKD